MICSNVGKKRLFLLKMNGLSDDQMKCPLSDEAAVSKAQQPHFPLRKFSTKRL